MCIYVEDLHRDFNRYVPVAGAEESRDWARSKALDHWTVDLKAGPVQ